MTSGPRRTAAAMPAAGYRRPELVGTDGLSVSVVGESGEDCGTFDFAGLEAPEELVRSLAAGFARASGPGGRWKSAETVREYAKTLRRFAPRRVGGEPAFVRDRRSDPGSVVVLAQRSPVEGPLAGGDQQGARPYCMT